MPPEPSWARNRYSPITRGSSGASAFISALREPVRNSPALHILRHKFWAAYADASSRLVTVAHSRLGDQPARPRRIGFELAAQPCHVEAEIARPLDERRAPDPGQDLRRPDQLARPL